MTTFTQLTSRLKHCLMGWLFFASNFWDLEETMLHEIHVSGNVGGPPLAQKSKNRGSGNRV